MYGTLANEFTIKGKVVDKENKESGLPGIQVLIRSNPVNYNYADTLYTDDKGEVITTNGGYSEQIRIIYEDKASDVFEKDSIMVTLEPAKQGEKWVFENDVTIEMERKTEEEK